MVFVSLGLLLLPVIVLAQEPDKNTIYDLPTVQPSFPGGTEAMYKYLSREIKYPREAYDHKIEGRVVVQFVVNSNGKVVSPEIMRGVDPSLDNEAIRLVRNMPKWIPGKVDNLPVNSRFTLPIKFILNSSHQAERMSPDNHLPLSGDLTGIWRLNSIIKEEDKITSKPTGIYRVMNLDNTYYTLMVYSEDQQPEDPTSVIEFGTYEYSSETSFIKKTTGNMHIPGLNGTEIECVFDPETSSHLYLHIKDETSGEWISEIWSRVKFKEPD